MMTWVRLPPRTQAGQQRPPRGREVHDLPMGPAERVVWRPEWSEIALQ